MVSATFYLEVLKEGGNSEPTSKQKLVYVAVLNDESVQQTLLQHWVSCCCPDHAQRAFVQDNHQHVTGDCIEAHQQCAVHAALVFRCHFWVLRPDWCPPLLPKCESQVWRHVCVLLVLPSLKFCRQPLLHYRVLEHGTSDGVSVCLLLSTCAVLTKSRYDTKKGSKHRDSRNPGTIKYWQSKKLT
jgi:hypothetical protein